MVGRRSSCYDEGSGKATKATKTRAGAIVRMYVNCLIRRCSHCHLYACRDRHLSKLDRMMFAWCLSDTKYFILPSTLAMRDTLPVILEGLARVAYVTRCPIQSLKKKRLRVKTTQFIPVVASTMPESTNDCPFLTSRTPGPMTLTNCILSRSMIRIYRPQRPLPATR